MKRKSKKTDSTPLAAKSDLASAARESPEARKKRVASGISFRPSVMADKKRDKMANDIKNYEMYENHTEPD